MATVSTAGAIMVFCWLAVDSPAGLVVWGLCYGFAGGAVLNVRTSLLLDKLPDS